MFTFQFLNDEIYSYTIKSHLVHGNLAKLVFWSILSFKLRNVMLLFDIRQILDEHILLVGHVTGLLFKSAS